MKIKFDRLILQSIFIFIISIKLPYISINAYLPVLLRLTFITVYLLKSVINNKLEKEIWVFLGWTAIILFSTIINRGSLFGMIDSFSSIVLVSIYYSSFNLIEKRIKVLKIWSKLLIFLCFFDGISMLLYPSGMPTKSYYKLTWFLGYKTARMPFVLPLIVILPYVSYIKNDKIEKYIYFIICFCIALTLKAQATAATVSLIFYIAVLFLIDFARNNTKWKKRFYSILNPINLLTIYGLLFILITIVQTNQYILYIVQNLFMKSEDISHRTLIWSMCFNFIR